MYFLDMFFIILSSMIFLFYCRLFAENKSFFLSDFRLDGREILTLILILEISWKGLN